MRGRILAFDTRAGEGHISGDDGMRYRFAAAEWKPQAAPARGQAVDFEAEGREALSVYPLVPAIAGDKSRIAAALLALFLGSLGIHKFYLNYNGAGLTMLLITVFGVMLAGIPSMVMALIALIEAVIYLSRSEAEFDRIYVEGRKPWF